MPPHKRAAPSSTREPRRNRATTAHAGAEVRSLEGLAYRIAEASLPASPDVAAIVRRACETPGLIVTVEAAAGHQPPALAIIADAYAASGYRVLVATPSPHRLFDAARAQARLAEFRAAMSAVGIGADTDTVRLARDWRRLPGGLPAAIDSSTVMLVADAEWTTPREMHVFLSATLATRARLVLAHEPPDTRKRTPTFPSLGVVRSALSGRAP